MRAWQSKFRGSLLGLAVGDALGAFFEGQPAEAIRRRYPTPGSLIADPPASEMYYTDDTQMSIGVAETLIEFGAIDEAGLCRAFVRNYTPHRGYGYGARCVLDAMAEGWDYRELAATFFPGGSYGNGAAMRVAPVGLFFHRDLDRVWEQARLSALPTHVHPLGVEGAQLVALATALCAAAENFDRHAFFDELRRRSEAEVFQQKLARAEQIESIEQLSELGNGIAAQDSCVTAIACFALFPNSYAEAVGTAILLGGDTDTIAAMTGAMSGAYLGVEAIPATLMDALEETPQGRSYLDQRATDLCERCINPN
jgi:poly(ADP-ribose) glycohydrolase ARH3